MEAERSSLSKEAGEGCEVERAAIPGGLRHVQRCEGFGLKSLVKTEMSGDAEGCEFKSRTVLNDRPPLEVMHRGRWTGPCPAGMSEYDRVGEEMLELAPAR
ncbi:hypothetical protein E4M02_00205 [Brevundimonas sp. S30B]|uniref:hypothetical protein n=1 Tax=unclassified Brevundimonas TaxID=2622653 RepID=UPI001072392F|nr:MULTISPECIES: hypothetical protein [unclassified Brevundimonas]QBX37650.1 hypothetical protein E4M01_07615 [Brevundimonas sp. MF30-B]TFW03557.1 hypothetical protein E4M02_00205 [Brevundimonas sp. S30B]